MEYLKELLNVGERGEAVMPCMGMEGGTTGSRFCKESHIIGEEVEDTI